MKKHWPKQDPLFEWLAWLMDESIPLGRWRIGLDGLLGLIPGIGDVAGTSVSVFIIARAMQTGIARSAIIRMIINAGVDSMLGALPLIGDFFDFAYKANSRNLQIYREALLGERRPSKDWAFIVVAVALLLLILALPLLGLLYLISLFGFRMPTF